MCLCRLASVYRKYSRHKHGSGAVSLQKLKKRGKHFIFSALGSVGGGAEHIEVIISGYVLREEFNFGKCFYPVQVVRSYAVGRLERCRDYAQID